MIHESSNQIWVCEIICACIIAALCAAVCELTELEFAVWLETVVSGVLDFSK